MDGSEEIPDGWECTAALQRETAKAVFGVYSGQRSGCGMWKYWKVYKGAKREIVMKIKKVKRTARCTAKT